MKCFAVLQLCRVRGIAPTCTTRTFVVIDLNLCRMLYCCRVSAIGRIFVFAKKGCPGFTEAFVGTLYKQLKTAVLKKAIR